MGGSRENTRRRLRLDRHHLGVGSPRGLHRGAGGRVRRRHRAGGRPAGRRGDVARLCGTGRPSAAIVTSTHGCRMLSSQTPRHRTLSSQMPDAGAQPRRSGRRTRSHAQAPRSRTHWSPDALVPDALVPDAWVRPPPAPPPQPPCLPLDCELGLPAVAAPAGLECEVPPPPDRPLRDDPQCPLIEFVGQSGVFGSIEEGGTSDSSRPVQMAPSWSTTDSALSYVTTRRRLRSSGISAEATEWLYDSMRAAERQRSRDMGVTLRNWNTTPMDNSSTSEKGISIDEGSSRARLLRLRRSRPSAFRHERGSAFHNDSGDSGFCNAYNAAGQLTGRV
jgi:hypothetical protein